MHSFRLYDSAWVFGGRRRACLSTYTTLGNRSDQSRILCTMRYIWMYGVIHRISYEVETQKAALQHQQVFDHHGSRQFGAKL